MIELKELNALIQVYVGSLLTPSTAGSKFDPYKRDFNLRSGRGWEKQPSNPHGLAAGVYLYWQVCVCFCRCVFAFVFVSEGLL